MNSDGKQGVHGGPFRALRHCFFRRFWIGQSISLTGTWMQGVAQRWLVYELTGSEALLGIVNALTSLPVALIAPFSGAVADRFEKRRILIRVQITATFIAFLLWLLTSTKLIAIWHIMILALGLGIVRAFDVTTRHSFWVELVGKRDLMSAITLNSAVVNLSRILGPSFAGVIIAKFGTATCFLLNAISFLPPLFVLLQMPSTPVPMRRNEPLLASLREGASYLVGNKTVFRMLLLIGAWSLFGGQFDVLLPVLADKTLGVREKGYGFLVASIGFGAILGAVFAAVLETKYRRGLQVMFGSLIAVMGLMVTSIVKSFPLALLSLSFVGFGMVMQNATCNTLVQTLIPDSLRGRVMGVYSLAFIGLAPLGSLFYGFFGKWLGVANALALGATCFAVAASALLLPNDAIRRLR
ncbi:MAG: MFS transporter [Candidatus Fervidibacter sp.]|uniref:MFS transporter n=1 Tax=Candidatus Fervidibacter sp. TaxID=3100871 RepID=UPI00404B47FE